MVALARFGLAYSAVGVGIVALVACSEPEAAGAGGSGASAGQASAGRAGDVGQGGGDLASAGRDNASGSGATPGNEGGQTGQAGASQSNAGQSNAAGGAGGEAASCVPPETIPVGGSDCPAACSGKTIAYEDCAGDGLVQAACGGAWFILQSACGDTSCQTAGFEEQLCAPGSVCMELVGGAHLLECRAHGCGTGPITCDCLQDACPGTCTQTGPLDFSCNTCPSGNCP